MNASLSVNLLESTVGNVPTSTASISTASSNRGHDTSLIIGVAIGGGISLILLIVLVIKLMGRKKKKQEKEEDEEKREEDEEETEKLGGQSPASLEEKPGDSSVPQLSYTPPSSGSSGPNQGQSDQFVSSSDGPSSDGPSWTPILCPNSVGPQTADSAECVRSRKRIMDMRLNYSSIQAESLTSESRHAPTSAAPYSIARNRSMTHPRSGVKYRI